MDKKTISLRECVDISLAQHPDLQKARAQIRQSSAQIGQTISSYYPQISFSSGYTRSGGPGTPYATSEGNIVSGTAKTSYDDTLSLRQYITDFGRTPNLVKASRENYIASLCDFQASENTIVYQVKSAYYACIASEALMRANQEYVDASESHLKQSQAFFSVGVRSKIEVTRSEVDLANAKLELSRASNVYKLAKVNLYNAMGQDSGFDLELESNLSLLEIHEPLEKFLQLAKQHKPDMLKAEAIVRASQARFTATTAEFAPTISSSARYNWNGSDYPLDRYWSIGLSLSVPITDGNYTVNRVKEARAQLDSVIAQAERTWQNVSFEVQKAYINIGESRERVDVAKKAVEQAEENFRLAESRYNVGVGSNLEFTDAQVALLQAKTSSISAQVDYFVAIAQLELSVGVPLDTAISENTGIEVNEEKQ